MASTKGRAQPTQQLVEHRTEPELAPGSHSEPVSGTKTTLGEHGMRTTIGCVPVELEPPGLPLKLRIGREVLSDPRCRTVVGQRAIRSLALTVRRLGDDDLTKMSLAERTVVVGQLPMVDLHYLSLLQMAAEDAGHYWLPIPAQTPCPRCRVHLPQRARVSLDDVKVHVFTERPSIRYRLQDRFRMLARDVTEFTMGPPSILRAIEHAREEDLAVDVLRELAWVAASITHTNGDEGPVSASALGAADPDTGRGLSQADWSGIKEAFNHAYGYVADSVVWRHACGEPLQLSLSWVEAFFELPGG